MNKQKTKREEWEKEFRQELLDLFEDHPNPAWATNRTIEGINNLIRSVRNQAIEEERERIRKWIFDINNQTGEGLVEIHDLLAHLNKK